MCTFYVKEELKQFSPPGFSDCNILDNFIEAKLNFFPFLFF